MACQHEHGPPSVFLNVFVVRCNLIDQVRFQSSAKEQCREGCNAVMLASFSLQLL